MINLFIWKGSNKGQSQVSRAQTGTFNLLIVSKNQSKTQITPDELFLKPSVVQRNSATLSLFVYFVLIRMRVNLTFWVNLPFSKTPNYCLLSTFNSLKTKWLFKRHIYSFQNYNHSLSLKSCSSVTPFSFCLFSIKKKPDMWLRYDWSILFFDVKSRCVSSNHMDDKTHGSIRPPLPPLSALSIILSELCMSIKRQLLDLHYIIHSVMEEPALLALFGKHTFQGLRCADYTQDNPAWLLLHWSGVCAAESNRTFWFWSLEHSSSVGNVTFEMLPC